MHQDPGERSSDPTGTESDLPASVGGSHVEVWVSSGLLQGWGHWWQQSGEVPVGMSLLGGHQQPYHKVCRLQAWVATGQATHSRQLDQFYCVWPAHMSKTQVFPSTVSPNRKLAQASQTHSPESGQEKPEVQLHSLQNKNHNHRC